MDKDQTDFERDGCLVIPGFLPADELQDLTFNLDRYVHEVVPGLPDADAFYQDNQFLDVAGNYQRLPPE